MIGYGQSGFVCGGVFVCFVVAVSFLYLAVIYIENICAALEYKLSGLT